MPRRPDDSFDDESVQGDTLLDADDASAVATLVDKTGSDEPAADEPTTQVDPPGPGSSHRIDVAQVPAASSLDALHDTLEDPAAPPRARPDEGRRREEVSPMVLDAPQRRVTARANAKRSGRPWWSWRGWQLRTKILAVGAGVLFSLMVATWLLLPTLAGWAIRQQLPQAEKELGRKIDFGGVELHGLSGLTLTDVVVYDSDGSGHFVDIGALTVRLTKSPLFHRDFKVESIKVTAPSVSLRRAADGTTNYEDFAEKLSKLFADKKKDPKKKKKPSPLGKYVKPLPRVEVVDGSIVFDDATRPEAAVERISDLDLVITQPDFGAPFEIDLSTGIDFRLPELGSHSRRIHVSGFYKNKRQGQLKVTFDGGLDVPLVEQTAGVAAQLGSITVQMPSTFVVEDVVVGSRDGGLATPLLTAERVSLELTQLPPKKIGGVYLTETRVEGLYLDLAVDEDGRTDIHAIAEQAMENILGPPPTPLQAAALALERHLERGARAGVGLKQRKQKKFDIADYFFSQRIFLERATVRLDDRGEGGSAVTFDDIDLALGYRPIQKRVELELALAIDGGVGGKLWLGGGYDLSPKTVDARLELDALALHPVAARLERTMRAEYARVFGGEGAASPAAPGVGDVVMLTLGQALRLGEVRVSSALELDLDLKRERYGARGSLGVEDLQLVEARLSRLPLDDLDFELELEASADVKARTVDVARLDVELDGAKLNSRARLAPRPAPLEPPRETRRKASDAPASDAPAPMAFELALSLPEQPAQQIFDGIPHGLRWALDGMEFAGTFGFDLVAAGTLDDLAQMSLETRLSGSDFEVTRWPSGADVTGLNRGMRMKVRDPRATVPHTIDIPPSTHAPSPGSAPWASYVPVGGDGHDERYPHWVPYHELSPWLVQLITTTEDGSFFRHQGFSTMQIASALGDNVADGGFVRGASTISMQLVKNVFLGRQKTLARKFQETFLTWLMESVVRVPKARILEVYFNVIEFGPEVYGIGDAARYYFGKRASDLSLRESAFLVSIIPRPRTGESHRLRGTITERKGERINWFIDKMIERKCDPARLDRLARHYEKQGRPVPVEFCCPSPPAVARLKAEPVTFYLPGLDAPEYRPDLYTFDGRRLDGPATLGCDVGEDGLQGGQDDVLLDPLEVPDPDAPLAPILPVVP